MNSPKGKVARTDGALDVSDGNMSLQRQHAIFVASLCKVTVDQVRCNNNLVYCAKSSDNLVEVFRGMLKHGFLAVPVFLSSDHRFFSWLSMMDVVRVVVDLFGKEKLTTEEDFWRLHETDEKFKALKVSDALSKDSASFHPVTTGFSLFSAVELIARVRGLHRVPIVNEKFEVINVITETRLLEVIHLNMEKLGFKKDKEVGDVVQHKDVITVSENKMAIEAFEIIVKSGISGVPIVDEEGKCVGTLSLSDLKTLGEDGRLFWRLFSTCSNFLHHLRQDYAKKYGRPRKLVSVKVTDKLESVISMILENKIHRVFVLDEDKRPISVISIKDILLELITFH